ncbi:MAG: hypothetical protein ACE5I2_10660 [Anaerolineae bacterium]
MDFDGNELVAIKYNAFSLCYSKLLAHLDDFEKSLRHQTRLTKEDVWARFDSVLQEDIYEASPESFEEATELMLDGLQVKRKSVATINPGVAEVIADIIGDIEAYAPTWRYRDDVGRWQTLGQELAQCFYADSPHTETQKRLGRDVALDFEWVGEIPRAPFGYREDCLAKAEEPVPGIIMVRFSFQDKFINYLAYPFFFLHEYLSHVYAVDTSSELFEDGWLLYAAHVFFKRRALRLGIAGLADVHLLAFDERIRPNLNATASKGFGLASLAEDWLTLKLGYRKGTECFAVLSRHLAALVPGEDVDTWFHGDFIYAFTNCRKTVSAQLHRWLVKTESDAIALYRRMSTYL